MLIIHVHGWLIITLFLLPILTLTLARNFHTMFYLQAFGDLVYPVMFGGDKPGQDKVTYLRTLILVGFTPVVVPLAHQNVRRY